MGRENNCFPFMSKATNIIRTQMGDYANKEFYQKKQNTNGTSIQPFLSWLPSCIKLKITLMFVNGTMFISSSSLKKEKKKGLDKEVNTIN